MSTIDRGAAQDDCQDGLADTGRAYEQHVGRVGEGRRRLPGEFSDESLVDRLG